MGEILPYILPLILGRTFNLTTNSIGTDIFPADDVSRAEVINRYYTNTHYGFISTSKEARDFLNAGGALSVDAKGGMFNFDASGSYLSDSFNRDNTAEVLIKAEYETVTESLPFGIKPIKDWKMLDPLGTHFVRSITYGGQLIVSIRLHCKGSQEKLAVKGAMGVGGLVSFLKLNIEGEGEYANNVSKLIETTEIKVFSSVPISSVPNSQEQVQNLVDGYFEDVRKFNDGKGVPIKIELWPLGYLDPIISVSGEFRQPEMNVLEDMLDDLLNTQSALENWMQERKEPLSEQNEEKVGQSYSKLIKMLQMFYTVIGNLDSNQNLNQISSVIEEYYKSGCSIIGDYYQSYLSLKAEVEADKIVLPKIRAKDSTYIHWGKKNCTKPFTKTFGGYGGGSSSGGGSNFQCIPEDPVLKLAEREEPLPQLRGLWYSNPFSNHQDSIVLCSSCWGPAVGTVQTFPARKSCPEHWTEVYRGYLMTSDVQNGSPSEHLCLDIEDIESVDQSLAKDDIKLNFVMSGCTGAECTVNFVPCVACSS